MHVSHRGLHDGVLILLVLKAISALLHAIDSTQQAARNGLKRRHPGLTIGSQNSKSSLQKSLVGEIGLILIGKARVRPKQAAIPCHS